MTYDGSDESPVARAQPVPPAARRQSRRLVSVVGGGVRQGAREQKPIFLSIGYSTCHWCHVMEHESFESPAIAEALNRDFVSIKVDREERPDIDRVYMSFVQATTGSVLQLLSEIAGGAVGQLDALSGFLPEAHPDFLHGKLQVGGRSYGYLLRGTESTQKPQKKRND